MTDAQRITALEKEIKILNNYLKYISSSISSTGGKASNDNRTTNFIIDTFLPFLPLIARLDAPLASGVAVTSLTCSGANYTLDNNDKFVIINGATGTQFDLVASSDTVPGVTTIVFDSFTPTEDIGTNSLIMFRMKRDSAAHFIKIDS